MVGKLFNEFLGHYTAEEAASQLRKLTKDRCVRICVVITLFHWPNITETNPWN